MGTPNREPQEYSGNIAEYKDSGRYVLEVPRWGFPIMSLYNMGQSAQAFS